MNICDLEIILNKLKDKGVDVTNVESRLEEIISSTASEPLPEAQ